MCVSTGLTLGIDGAAIHDDVEDAGATGDEGQIGDHVLVVAEQVASRAHGAVGIISRDAVGDRDAMALVRHSGEVSAHLVRLRCLAMKATVIYESLTGNTRQAAEKIADELNRSGIEAVACSIKAIELQHLSESDLVVVGSWVDGLFLVGQKPAGVRRLVNLPVIHGKKTAVFCTYALETGKTLEKLSGIVERRGGDVIGGMAIKRTKIDKQSIEFVDRLVGALESA